MSRKSGRMAYGKGNELLCGLVKVPAHPANILASLHWKSAGVRVKSASSRVCMKEIPCPLCPSTVSQPAPLLVLPACATTWPRPPLSLQKQSAVYNRDAVKGSPTRGCALLSLHSAEEGTLRSNSCMK